MSGRLRLRVDADTWQDIAADPANPPLPYNGKLKLLTPAGWAYQCGDDFDYVGPLRARMPDGTFEVVLNMAVGLRLYWWVCDLEKPTAHAYSGQYSMSATGPLTTRWPTGTDLNTFGVSATCSETRYNEATPGTDFPGTEAPFARRLTQRRGHVMVDLKFIRQHVDLPPHVGVDHVEILLRGSLEGQSLGTGDPAAMTLTESTYDALPTVVTTVRDPNGYAPNYRGDLVRVLTLAGDNSVTMTPDQLLTYTGTDTLLHLPFGNLPDGTPGYWDYTRLLTAAEYQSTDTLVYTLACDQLSVWPPEPAPNAIQPNETTVSAAFGTLNSSLGDDGVLVTIVTRTV